MCALLTLQAKLVHELLPTIMSQDLTTNNPDLSFDESTADGTLVNSNQPMHTAPSMISDDPSTSPLLCLPHEILELILIYAAMEEGVREWMVYGQICTSLRHALLGLQSLWGDAVSSVGSRRFRDMILERAGLTAPLHLVATGSWSDPDAAKFAMAHLQRARIIYAQDPVFVRLFAQNKEHQCLPYLEEVDIDSAEIHSVVALTQVPKETPRLKRVTLRAFLWAFTPSTMLTMLKLFCRKESRAYTPSQFLDLLRQSSHLQHLDLSRCIPYLADDVASAAEISFAHLGQLTIHDKREYALQLWRVLSVNPDTKVDFTLECHTPDHSSRLGYRGPPCFQDAALFKGHVRGRRPVALTVTGFTKEEIGLIVSFTPHSSELQQSHQPTHSELGDTLKLVHKFKEHGPPLSDYMSSVRRACTELELSNNVERLSWSSATHLGLNILEGDWATILQDFQNVTCLEVAMLSRSLCTALGSPMSAFTSTDNFANQSLLLPKLRELSAGDAMLLSGNHGQLFAPTTAMFFEMMHKRTVQGNPLKALGAQGFRVSPINRADTNAKDMFLEELRSRFPDCHLKL